MTGGTPWGPAGEPDDPRHGAVDPRGPYHEFSRRVRGRHYWILGTPLCACTQPARLCPDLRDAHTLFGDHVPWRPQNTLPLRPPTPLPAPHPAPRPTPHPVQFRPPRPYKGEL